MESSGSGTRLYWRLAIGLIAAAGAYAWFVTVQYGRLNDLNQRELANAAAELRRSFENAVETVTRFEATKDGALCKFDTDQPYLTLETPRDCHDMHSGQLDNVTATVGPPLAIKTVATDSNASVVFQFRADLVLRELSFPDSFGLIFIASDSGEVLYQEAPSK